MIEAPKYMSWGFDWHRVKSSPMFLLMVNKGQRSGVNWWWL